MLQLGKNPFLLLGTLAFLLSCKPLFHSSSETSKLGFWYAESRNVPPLELHYHEVLSRLPQGEDMRSKLCFGFQADRAKDFDKVRQTFCQSEVPNIQSLLDLEQALGLAIPEGTPAGQQHNGVPGLTPGWVLTGQSTSLVNRYVSPINPRVILFTAPSVDDTPIADLVLLGFVRGDQFAEVIAREPKSGHLKFFLVAFQQDCLPNNHCSVGHLQSPAIEKDWVSYTIYEDSYLVNTVFDCTHCHQPEGPQSEKILRMQENQRPWTHFFRSDTQGQQLIARYKDFHGESASIGGIPADLISSSDPEKLARLLKANGFGLQPNEFAASTIALEVSERKGPGKTWHKGWQKFLQGESIPFPSFALDILDEDRYRDLKLNYQALKTSGAARDQWPDLRSAVDDRLGPTLGTRAPREATGKQLLVLACQRCHNQKLDANLGKSQFKVDVSKGQRSSFNVKNAIERLEILKNDPANPLAMPPRLFMDLTPEEIEILIAELKSEL